MVRNGLYISYGTRMWYKDDLLHNDDDLPALVYPNGNTEWYQYGKRHRDNDKPSVISHDGREEWYQHGERHRDDDKPSAVYSDGTRVWSRRGKIHRDNDLHAILCSDGTRKWFDNGILSRLRGPAIICTTCYPFYYYYINGNKITKNNIHVIRRCSSKWLKRLRNRYEIVLIDIFKDTPIPVDIVKHMIMDYLYY